MISFEQSKFSHKISKSKFRGKYWKKSKYLLKKKIDIEDMLSDEEIDSEYDHHDKRQDLMKIRKRERKDDSPAESLSIKQKNFEERFKNRRINKKMRVKKLQTITNFHKNYYFINNSKEV